MTEEEAKKALFAIHFEYMMHSLKEREKLYPEYERKRNEIKLALSKAISERLEEENSQNKTK